MQKDMHFYGVYALARAAGVKDEAALTVARASQFVDDATDDHVVSIRDKTILSTMTSHRMLDPKNANAGDQWRVWVPFHFLPGNQPADGSFDERMICRKDSEPAQAMKAFALDPRNRRFWPHLIGVTAHVYADTFSHFGFAGYSCGNNKVREYTIRVTGEPARNIARFVGKLIKRAGAAAVAWIAERVPVGHGAVGAYPDNPCISWKFQYENGAWWGPDDTTRNNHANFLDGCRCLHQFFQQYLVGNLADKDSGVKSWDSISAPVARIMTGSSGTSLETRIGRWKEAIGAGAFCTPTELDRNLHYHEDCWDLDACRKANDGEAVEDARKFIRAAFLHRNFVLHELLPELGLITY